MVDILDNNIKIQPSTEKQHSDILQSYYVILSSYYGPYFIRPIRTHFGKMCPRGGFTCSN